jgi:hypothetical protein
MKTVEHLTKEQLQAYSVNSLAPGEADSVGKHLLQCAACRDRLPVPTPEQFWSALLVDEPEREESFGGENLAPARSPSSFVFTFWRQPAVLGACALILIAGFSFLIWLGASKQTNPEPEVARTNETPKKAETSNTENNFPITENLPDTTTGDQVQTAENQNDSRLQLQRPAKSEINSSNATKTPNKPRETENRELAQLLENTPPAVSSLRPNGEMILRNGNNDDQNPNNAPAFALLAPVGETVLENAPEFRWQKAANAKSYRISILDADFNEVLTAEMSGNSFTPGKPLKRGAKYLWRVAAQTASGEIIAPLPPQPPAVFRVAAENTESRIASLQKNENDRLKLAVFYAREGMLDAAACTLKEILAKNPNQKAARRLLAQVERWKKENNATAVQRCGPSTATKADQ